MKRIQELFWSIIGNIASNFLWLPITSSIIPLLGIWAAQAWQLLETPWVGASFGIGWFTTWFIASIWYHNNRKNTYIRLVSLGSMLFVSDIAFRKLLLDSPPRTPPRFTKDELRIEVEQLLSKMCAILAYRLEGVLKGATFLEYLPDPSSPDGGGFELFAHHQHTAVNVRIAIKDKVKVKTSLAGQAIEEDRLIVCRDCRFVEKGLRWADTANPHGYIGRAVAPVRRADTSPRQFIGVVCFDVKRPWNITKEEEDIVNMVADKISYLWSFYQ